MDRLRYLFGVITLVVMVGGGYFLFHQLEEQGAADLYRIEVTFLDARGLKSGADVKFRGIQVGSVRDISVSEDNGRAVVLLSLPEDQRSLVRDNSSFWIVTPRFHGISTGVSGLDTLVRDAYVAFSTPKVAGTDVPSGGRLTGAEAPDMARLPSLQRGDLLMRVLLPENHGVALGARVMFRGMPTGEVRGIELAPTGSHVIVSLRIASSHRSTVTDNSVFWVAQPSLNLQFSFSNPVSVNELGSLLSPHLAYYTAPRAGVPVPDGYVVAALMDRPSIKITEVPDSALTQRIPNKKPGSTGPVVLVRVIYAAEDVDWLTPNDTLHREGTGVLYLDTGNRPYVLTPRSVCDASYYHNETLGWKEIKNERIRVQLGQGQALTATRAWVEKNGIDLAVLRVEGLPRNYATSKVTAFSFAEYTAAGSQSEELHICGETGVREDPVAFDLAGLTALNTGKIRGGVVLRAGKIVGLVGQVSGEDSQAIVVSLTTLPAASRPAK